MICSIDYFQLKDNAKKLIVISDFFSVQNNL